MAHLKGRDARNIGVIGPLRNGGRKPIGIRLGNAGGTAYARPQAAGPALRIGWLLAAKGKQEVGWVAERVDAKAGECCVWADCAFPGRGRFGARGRSARP